MSDDKKPKCEIKFANGMNIQADIIDIIDIGETDNGGLRDEVAIDFGPNGEISTMNGCNFSFECSFDPQPELFEKLKQMHDESIKRQVESN